MLVKICGITNEQDARAAVRAGADWIGLNLVGGPRRIDPSRAAAILATIGDGADTDSAGAQMANATSANAVVLVRIESSLPQPQLAELHAAGARRLQLYGEVSPDHIARLRAAGWSVMTVHHVTDAGSLRAVDAFVGACAKGAGPEFLLLDAKSSAQLGGTGVAVDWDMLAQARASGTFDHWPPIILAGGLNPQNVGRAVELVRPAGVDVSSGVEREPGKKDAAKMAALVREAKDAARWDGPD